MMNASFAHFIGNFFVKKCAENKGTCRQKCRDKEKQAERTHQTCRSGKQCCIRIDPNIPVTCRDSTKPTTTTAGSQQDTDTPYVPSSPDASVAAVAATGRVTSAAAMGIMVSMSASTASTATATSDA